MKTILIYRKSPAFGKMYLTKDGAVSNRIEDAAFFWASQFRKVVRENWIVSCGGKACAEIVKGGAK